MSTTVSYKGNTLTTVNNNTKTLETEGKYLEADIILTDVSGGANLQAKSNIDPTTSSQTITADAGYDGLSSVQINAMPSGSLGVPTNSVIKTETLYQATKTYPNFVSGYFNNVGTIVFQLPLESKTVTPSENVQVVTPTSTARYLDSVTVDAMPSGTAGTPTATKSAVSNHSLTVTPSVTNTTGYITGGTKTGTAVSVSASELVSGTKTITSSGDTDVTNYATATIAAGTEGTPSATKGAVSGNAVTVTPSVTNTAGHISGGTHTGTGVTVSASELVSGSETKTANGTYDVTNLAQLVVNVSGGGTLTVATKTLMNTATTQTLSFTSLSGQPKYWFLRMTSNVSSSGSTTYYYVTDCFYDGTSVKGNTFRIGQTRRVQNVTSGITQVYSGGTLTITAGSSSGSTPGQFYGASGIGYELVYIY